MSSINFSSYPNLVLTPKVRNDFEKVRAIICKELMNQDVKDKILQLFLEITHLDDNTIHNALQEILEILTPEIYMSIDSQLFFGQKQLGEDISSGGDISTDTFVALQGFILPAIVDVFYLVCLHINSGLSKQKLKGLLYLNMQYGGGTGINTLFGEDPTIMSGQDWNESYKTLRGNTSIYPQDKIDPSIIGKETKDFISQTVCPFRYNQERGKFIDDLWDFFEIEIMPLLQENFKESKDTYEMFFSGNLGNTLQKESSN